MIERIKKNLIINIANESIDQTIQDFKSLMNVLQADNIQKLNISDCFNRKTVLICF